MLNEQQGQYISGTSGSVTYGKIFIVFSDTGAGHRSAAEAIKKGIFELCSQAGQLRPEIVMRDVIDKSNELNHLFEQMYNRLLRTHEDWMKYYIDLIEWIKPNESEFGYQLVKKYAEGLIKEVNPAVIVSVHPMVNHFLARTLKDLGLAGKVKLITVLTDPNAELWTGWACPDADLTIAPNDLARDRLISLGLNSATIKVIGMPISPEFLRPPTESRKVLLSKLGLNPDIVTIAISAGSAGGGNMPAIYRALGKVRKPVQVIFLCGKNKKLEAEMELASQECQLRTVVLAYATAVADGMNACDLLVTKAGGLTTFEAIARRLPMAFDLLTEPMPQEAGTVKLLIDAGLAKPIYRPDDILPIAESLSVVTGRQNLPLPAAHNLNCVDAVYEIARLILNLASPVNNGTSSSSG